MTIVVPVKDRATLVLRTLDSIKAQTWRPLKLIVVDNGSADGTPASVENWIAKNEAPDFEVKLLTEPRPGAAVARNTGLEDVDTRLMMFFDSDDIMEPRHVETIMNRFYAGDDPDLVCFRVIFHPIEGEDRITHGPGRNMMANHICHAVMRTQGYACETALARRAGGWDEEVGGWDDLEFGARMIIEARRRAYIRDVNVQVYARADSITGTQFSSRRGEWEAALDKMEQAFEKSRHREKDRWKKILAYKRAILAAHYKKEKNTEAARKVMEKALAAPGLNALQRAYLKFSYKFTSIGGRGTAILLNLLF